MIQCKMQNAKRKVQNNRKNLSERLLDFGTAKKK